MAMRALSVVLGAVLLLGGCVPSLNPLYTKDDLIFDAELVGTWKANDGKTTWEFSKRTDGQVDRYHLLFTDNNGKTGQFKTHLLEIDGHRFLDLFPADPATDASPFYKAHILPVHTFLYVKRIDSTLQMRTLYPEPVKRYLDANPEVVEHTTHDERGVLLTADTKSLQEFMLSILDQEELLGRLMDLTREEQDSDASAD